MEAKIDRLLAAIENTSQNGTQAAPQAEISQGSSPQADGSEDWATAATRRKAQELNVELSEVSGTGMNGQITVDDVRRQSTRGEGES